MNLLTKAFVVVVTILAVMLVALVVPFAARVENYAQQYEDKKKEAAAIDAALSEELVQARAKMADTDAELAAAKAQITTLSNENSQLQAENIERTAQLNQANETMSQLTYANEIVVRVSETKDSRIGELTNAWRQAQETVGTLNTEYQQVNSALIESRALYLTVRDNYSRLQERFEAAEQQISELEERNATLNRQLAELDFDPEEDAGPVTPPSGVVIRGTVVATQEIGDGGTLVQVDVGSRDQVQRGMEFTVSRGDEYVGKVLISTIDTGAAVGQLTNGTSVRPGDTVVAGGQ